ncbi:TMEM175 family protein [Geodermatophilus sp. SYSU D01105]
MGERLEQHGDRVDRVLSTGRLEAFSDGVFAIAITLLVLEISVPDDSEHDLLGALLDQWPSYLAYGVSFATIGGVWLAHNVVTEYLRQVDPVFIRLNLLLLMTVSLLPFPTRLLAEHIQETQAERVAATVYGLTLLASVLLVSGLWRYAVRRRLVDPDAQEADIRVLSRRLQPGTVGYAALIVLGLFLPQVALFGYLLIAVGLIVPVRRRTRRRV